MSSGTEEIFYGQLGVNARQATLEPTYCTRPDLHEKTSPGVDREPDGSAGNCGRCPTRLEANSDQGSTALRSDWALVRGASRPRVGLGKPASTEDRHQETVRTNGTIDGRQQSILGESPRVPRRSPGASSRGVSDELTAHGLLARTALATLRPASQDMLDGWRGDCAGRGSSGECRCPTGGASANGGLEASL